MSQSITLGDKEFVPYLSQEKIRAAVTRIANYINEDLDGLNPLLICVLNGSFVFAADLVRELTIQHEVTFIRMKSYIGTASSGEIKMLQGLDVDIKDRTVVIVEDIIDTGYTMRQVIGQLKEGEPADVKVATLLLKPDSLKVDIPIDYAAMEIPDDFIVGYGLDYNEMGRNLKDIYVVVSAPQE